MFPAADIAGNSKGRLKNISDGLFDVASVIRRETPFPNVQVWIFACAGMMGNPMQGKSKPV